MSLSLTVFFEDPFWVGLFCRSEGDQAQYCRVVFGGEPSDIQIYHYFLHNWRSLQFSEKMPAPPPDIEAKNPKRRQRQVNRELKQHSGEKRSYAIIKQIMQTTQKEVRKLNRSEEVLEHARHVYEVKQARHKQKHRGH